MARPLLLPVYNKKRKSFLFVFSGNCPKAHSWSESISGGQNDVCMQKIKSVYLWTAVLHMSPPSTSRVLVVCLVSPHCFAVRPVTLCGHCSLQLVQIVTLTKSPIQTAISRCFIITRARENQAARPQLYFICSLHIVLLLNCILFPLNWPAHRSLRHGKLSSTSLILNLSSSSSSSSSLQWRWMFSTSHTTNSWTPWHELSESKMLLCKHCSSFVSPPPVPSRPPTVRASLRLPGVLSPPAPFCCASRCPIFNQGLILSLPRLRLAWRARRGRRTHHITSVTQTAPPLSMRRPIECHWSLWHCGLFIAT